ncbi:MAG: LptF/LptG family permease, partial [Akkermansiaceae bacterium]|nr:LptF/LptG family permease [Akkermansiaceae bacterium]
RMTMTKRYSFSMACLAFAFIAVPLGLTSRRAETSRGLIISLMIAVAYFLTMEMSEQINNHRVASVMLWVPNLICIGLGMWFFLKARFK